MGSASSSAPLTVRSRSRVMVWVFPKYPGGNIPRTFRLGLSEKILCEAKIRME